LNANQLAFIALGGLAFLGALGVVLIPNPVRAALALVVNFFVLGLLYFVLGSQMMGISQIMVYAGAIMVLFLFVIMMLKLDKKAEEVAPGDAWRKRFTWLIGAVIGGAIFGGVMLPLASITTRVNPPQNFGTPQAVGWSLFTTYVWPFEVISVLLLVGIVGSIMLAKRRF
jgi:NADH-quinone oxidoreductase subunit J